MNDIGSLLVGASSFFFSLSSRNGFALCVKKYNFTVADGGISNKMRNFVS